jgi:cytochrome b561
VTDRVQYDTTAKVFHWLIVALLVVQYSIGWLMPDVHRGPPGVPMVFHISFGFLNLVLIVLRFAWRLTHPVAPDSSLSPLQRRASEAVHWLLYALVFATTMTGWLFVSMRGWSIALFFVVPLPMLTAKDSQFASVIGHLHEPLEWALIVMIGIHVASALAHVFIYRDNIMQRMSLR